MNRFDFQPVLTGRLIALRPFEPADFAALYAIAANPVLWAQHPVPALCEEAVFRAGCDDDRLDFSRPPAVGRGV